MKSRVIVALLLALFAFNAHARGNIMGVCGRGGSTILVPDYVCFDGQGRYMPYKDCSSYSRAAASMGRPPAQFNQQPQQDIVRVDFTHACSAHDACYGKDGASKDSCDVRFYESLKQACRVQIPAGSEAASRACYETAILYNDVVRGQKTMVGSIEFNGMHYGTDDHHPFFVSGEKACNAYLTGQRVAGVEDPSCADPTIGEWKPRDTSWQPNVTQKKFNYIPPPKCIWEFPPCKWNLGDARDTP